MAGAQKEQIQNDGSRKLHISVREAPQQGRANARVRECVAGYYGVPLSAVRLISGHHRPAKMFSVETDGSH